MKEEAKKKRKKEEGDRKKRERERERKKYPLLTRLRKRHANPIIDEAE